MSREPGILRHAVPWCDKAYIKAEGKVWKKKIKLSQPCIHTMQALYKIIQNNMFSLMEHGEVTGFLSACEAGSELDEGGTTWEKEKTKQNNDSPFKLLQRSFDECVTKTATVLLNIFT